MAKRPWHQQYQRQKIFAEGRSWHSKLELSVYHLLKMMERGGKLRDIKCQVHVRFHTYEHGSVKMIPDFSAIDCTTNELIYIEAKGFEDARWVRKRKAWLAGGPAKMYVYKGSWQSPRLSEILEPKKEEENS